jgi:orotate phosphoribosyltransferase
MSENSREALAQRIYAASNIKGQFRLRSGAISDRYFDKYLFESDPVLLREIAQAMSKLIPTAVDALAGLEMGGIPIVTVLSQITGIPALFVRKKAKEYGTCKLVEGGQVGGRRLVIIEDIVTSAGQIRESAKALREREAEIMGVLCVVDREEGGRENLAKDDLALHSLYTTTELKEALSV